MSKRQALTTSVYLDTSEAGTRAASADTTRLQPLRYENSYRVEPEHPFPVAASTKIIKAVLTDALTGKSYNKQECISASRVLADKIKDCVKNSLSPQRYKLVSYVVIGQTDSATVAMTSRCVWNDKFDTRAEAVFKNSSLYAIGVLYGIYTE